MKPMRFSLLVLAISSALAVGQESNVPDLSKLIARPGSELEDVARHYAADRGSLLRTYAVAGSPARLSRLNHFYQSWSKALDQLDASKLSEEGREELKRLKESVERERQRLEEQAQQYHDAAPLLPFAATVFQLEDRMRRMEPVDSVGAATAVNAIRKQINKVRDSLDAQLKSDSLPLSKSIVTDAAEAATSLRGALKNWFDFYNLYDPVFTWWMAEPMKDADSALQDYIVYLKQTVAPKATESKAAKNPNPVVIPPSDRKLPSDVPDLQAIMKSPRSEMRPVLSRFFADRAQIGRMSAMVPGRRPAPYSPERAARARKFYSTWSEALTKLDFDKLSRDAQIDYLLLKNYIAKELHRIDVQEKAQTALVFVPEYIKNALARVRVRDESGIEGRPIGRDALLAELAGELIPYTPEELVAIAEQEYAWCEAEMKKASRDMGLGDDWKKAIELVKTRHVEPGRQPELIRDLSREAVTYLNRHGLVTVPPLADETWRRDMMSPQRQLISPFFTGGEVISIAFPTSTMSHDAKLQSLRGNNVHFSRATVHHELIPGHHLQGFMTARHKSYRGPFATSFWTEGNALYWEFVLYGMGFPRSPEDRVGFLFWRMHRSARVVFSLNFHLGVWKPKQCIDYLVEKVGHERDNATAEVRRSFGGGYGPLYQLSYLMGGLQFRALRQELVDTRKMKERDFHDALLQHGRIPIALLRAAITTEPLQRDFKNDWKFYGPNPAKKPTRSEAP